jgi:hypothetical protein
MLGWRDLSWLLLILHRGINHNPQVIAQSHFGGLSQIGAKLVDLMLDEGDKYDYYKVYI